MSVKIYIFLIQLLTVVIKWIAYRIALDNFVFQPAQVVDAYLILLARYGHEYVDAFEHVHLLEASAVDQRVDLALSAPVQQHQRVLGADQQINALIYKINNHLTLWINSTANANTPESGAQNVRVKLLAILSYFWRVLLTWLDRIGRHIYIYLHKRSIYNQNTTKSLESVEFIITWLPFLIWGSFNGWMMDPAPTRTVLTPPLEPGCELATGKLSATDFEFGLYEMNEWGVARDEELLVGSKAAFWIGAGGSGGPMHGILSMLRLLSFSLIWLLSRRMMSVPLLLVIDELPPTGFIK